MVGIYSILIVVTINIYLSIDPSIYLSILLPINESKLQCLEDMKLGIDISVAECFSSSSSSSLLLYRLQTT